MKNKVRLQKLLILCFMTFAVFNYNNCELSNTSNVDPVDEPIEDDTSSVIGTPKSGGSEDEDSSPKSGGSDEEETSSSKGGGTSSFDLKLQVYTDSNLHQYLISACGSCHKGDYFKGGHGDTDVEVSINDLLYYGYVSESQPYGKVDFENSENSLLYTKALAGHNGANAPLIISYINEWIAGYESLVAESEVVIDEEEIVVDESSVWRTIDELTIISSEAILPTSASTLSFEIDSATTMTLEVDYDLEQELYLLKKPTLFRSDGQNVYIKEMRCLINGVLDIKYGTWSSINKTFSDGDVIGSNPLFMEAISPGSDKLKLGFIELAPASSVESE